jgi:hypothetical protein
MNGLLLIKTYKLGDILPDGSVVFHVDVSGKHGLAAQTLDETTTATWHQAELLAEAHGLGWRLPNNVELNLLYEQRNVVGNFVNANYWSCTGNGLNSPTFQSFFNGHQYYNCHSFDWDDDDNDYTANVRAIRAF